MIQSMTGFVTVDDAHDWGRAHWQIRSLNNRYLDVKSKLPSNLIAMEQTIQTAAKKYFSRGRLDILLRIELTNELQNSYEVNELLVKQLQKLHTEIDTITGNQNNLRSFDLMKWSDVLRKVDSSYESIQDVLLESFDKALENLKASREQEGKKLHSILSNRTTELSELVGKIKKLSLNAKNVIQEKLEKLVNDNNLSLDQGRLEQEVVFYAQKADITEEIERLEAHIEQLQNSLNNGGAIGKRLDFLMQEMNREANTIASKSNDVNLSHHAVDIKVMIEQLREQIQNIE